LLACVGHADYDAVSERIRGKSSFRELSLASDRLELFMTLIARALPYISPILFSLLSVVFVTSAEAQTPWRLEQMVGEDERGQRVFRARPIDNAFRNPWPQSLEAEFQERARFIIDSQSQLDARGSTYFENEKRWYGTAMAHVLGGRANEGLQRLQERDHQHDEWHRETGGIDFYACFTLKHQMRKYFYFGDMLDPEYRRTMFEGAKRWTQKNPLRRTHYAFTQKGSGWGPDVMNSWVDVRSTDNLYLMRVASVYLMAEETGNHQTAAMYKQHILDYTATLYHVGLGEWDSENYLGHSIAPVTSLYDFAKDAEVKLAAKAILDFMYAIGAVKYHHGAFHGPSKRDYNHTQPFGGSAASMLWVHFGDTPRRPEHWESDEVHLVTSAYRPPPAVVMMAQENYPKPIELFASKPPYSATTSGDLAANPAYLETQYLANTYKLGSLASGTTPGKSDVSGLKLTVDADRDGGVSLQATPTNRPAFPGSPQYQEGVVTCENRVAQFENLAIWLAKDGNSPWLWVIPQSVSVTQQQGATVLQCDRTWVALLPIALTPFALDALKTAEIAESTKQGRPPKFPRHQVLFAQGVGGDYSGFAMVVGEAASHGDFANFCEEIRQTQLYLDRLTEGNVTLITAGNKSLRIGWSEDPQELLVLRNGLPHDWQQHASYLYRPAKESESPGPIRSRWCSGQLTVHAGGYLFQCEVTRSGKVTFSNRAPAEEPSAMCDPVYP
jgi:hypothetical protein